MKIIGLTGSSGSGKTTVCKILEQVHNAKIIDADKIAKELSKKGEPYLESIVQSFGTSILTSDGELNRKDLANIIYNNKEKREQLNNITFIYVVNEIKKKIDELKDEELIILDAPLLFESKLNKICDFVIGIIADKELKIQRICNRDNIDKKTALNRLNIQIDNDYLKRNVDYVIYNNSNLGELKEKIKGMNLK